MSSQNVCLRRVAKFVTVGARALDMEVTVTVPNTSIEDGRVRMMENLKR